VGRSSRNCTGENNPNWKGGKSWYASVHFWIKKIKGKALNYKCTFKDETCKGRMEWSNVSGKYRRNLSDWQILCCSHHKRFDKTGFGKKHSEETKKKMAESHKGKKMSKDTKNKISETCKRSRNFVICN